MVNTPAGNSLPKAQCIRREFGDLSADPNAAPWRDLPAIAFLDIITGAMPSQETLVKLAWEADGLRVLFHASDTHVWATMTERDAPLYEEEVVEVFLDPV